MKKRKFISIVVGTTLALMLGACGTEEVGSTNVNVSTEQTESLEQEKEENVEVLILETKHVYYSSKGEVESSFETEYDMFGNPTKEIENNGKREKVREYVNEYDKDNNLIKQVISINGEVGECVNEYDKNNNLIKKSFYDSSGNGEISGYIYEYDTLGKLVYQKQFIGDVYPEWEEWIYDENENLLKHTKYCNPELYGEKINRVEEYAYDTKGNLIKEVHYLELDEYMQIEYWHEFEYDEMNNRIKDSECNDNGFASQWCISEYDDLGNVIKTEYHFAEKGMTFWIEFEYDTNGNMTRETEHSVLYERVSSTQYKYEYDSSGNVTKYTEYNARGNVIEEIEYITITIEK